MYDCHIDKVMCHVCNNALIGCGMHSRKISEVYFDISQRHLNETFETLHDGQYICALPVCASLDDTE